ADHDQPLRRLSQSVQLSPGQDPLAVGSGVRQFARACSRCDQDHVCRKDPLALCSISDHSVRGVEPTAPDHQIDVVAKHPLLDVAGLRICKIKYSLVHGGEVDTNPGADVALIMGAEAEPE